VLALDLYARTYWVVFVCGVAEGDGERWMEFIGELTLDLSNKTKPRFALKYNTV